MSKKRKSKALATLTNKYNPTIPSSHAKVLWTGDKGWVGSRKPLSKQDKHRLQVAERKQKQ